MRGENNKCSGFFSFILLLAIIAGFLLLINYETKTTPPASSSITLLSNNTTKTGVHGSSSTGSAPSSSSSASLTIDQILADISSTLLSNYPTTAFVNTQLASKLNNTGPVTLKGNLTLSSGGTLIADGNIYPTTLGSTGQVLTTDGAGHLSWTTITTTAPTPAPSPAPTPSVSPSLLATKLNNTGPAIFTGDLTVTGGNVTVTGGSFTVDGNTYPTTLGSSDQVLTTDGAGHLNWAAVPVTSITNNNINTIVQFNGTADPSGVFTLDSNRFVIDASLRLQNLNVGVNTLLNSSYNIDFNALNTALVRFTNNVNNVNGDLITLTVSNCTEDNVGVQVTVINAMGNNASNIVYLARSTCNNENSYVLQPSDSIVLTCYHSDVTRTNTVNCASNSGSNLNYMSNFISVNLASTGSSTTVLTNVTSNNSYQGIIQVTIPAVTSRGLAHPFQLFSNYITPYTSGCLFTMLTASTFVSTITINAQIINYNTNSISFSIVIAGDTGGDNIAAGSVFTMAFKLI